MPVFIHLADEKNSKQIKVSGIKKGKISGGIFFMPMLPNYFVSYQWVRELRRRGVKNFVAVQFKLDSTEMVWAGKYFEAHRYITVGEAIKEVNELDDPLGYQIFIERKIYANEILRIKHIPQKIGWRYRPHSHRRPLTCACRICLPRGSMKSRKLRARLQEA